MHVVLSGATGFIGRRVLATLHARGDVVVALTRDPTRAKSLLGESVECVAWEPTDAHGAWEERVAGADAVVHLAGEPLMTHRWNDRVKARIRDSRIEGTRHLVDAVVRAASKPRVFVCASGVDYYGDTGDVVFDESGPAGHGYLPEVCEAWETEAARAGTAGVREVRLRTGVVLGERGGALHEMERPFRFLVGGPLGGGRQWVSWIHLDDVARVIATALDEPRLAGPVNVVAPESVRMKDFARALGRAMHRPSWAPVPGFALRLAVGEASVALITSKRLVPRALERVGFSWRYSELASAFEAALREL